MILERIFSAQHHEERSRPAPDDDFWYGDYGQQTNSGVRIDASTALQIGAVFSCVRVLSESISSLPCLMYEKTETGRRRTENHPLSDLLHYQPNNYQTAVEFWDMMVGHMALRGRSYAEIIQGPRGFADQLIPLHPDRVQVKYNRRGRPDYTYTEPDGTKRDIPWEYMFDVKGPLDGVSVVTAARESFGLAKATEEHAARLFGQGIQLSGVLEHPNRLDDESADRIAKSFSKAYSGVGNAHRPAVLEEGMKWNKIGLTAEDSQFIQSRKFQLNEIARWFRMPPHLIGDLERATFSNIEEMGINFVVHTLRPWLVRIESAIRRDLIVNTNRFYSEFLVDALMRGDIKSRYDAYNVGIQAGILAPNEPRQWENLNPKEGLDEPLRPLNMVPVNQAQEEQPQQQQPTPQPSQMEESEAEPQQDNRFMKLLKVGAERVLNKEIKAIRASAKKLNEPEFNKWLEDFYTKHIDFVSENLCISNDDAKRLCDASMNEIRQTSNSEVCNLVDEWQSQRSEQIIKYVSNCYGNG